MDTQKSLLEMQALVINIREKSKQSADSMLACKSVHAEQNKKSILEHYFALTVEIEQLLQKTDQVAATWSEYINRINFGTDRESARRLQELTEAYFTFRCRIGALLDKTEHESYRDTHAFRPDTFCQSAIQIQYACAEFDARLKT